MPTKKVFDADEELVDSGDGEEDDDGDAYEDMEGLAEAQPPPNIWSSLFDPFTYFDTNFTKYLIAFFDQNAVKQRSSGLQAEPRVSFDQVAAWRDLESVLTMGDTRIDVLKAIWLTGLDWISAGRPAHFSKPVNRLSRAGRLQEPASSLALGDFLRVNAQVDALLNQLDRSTIAAGAADATDATDGTDGTGVGESTPEMVTDEFGFQDSDTEIRQLKRSFRNLAGPLPYITFKQLLQYRPLRLKLEAGNITMNQIRELWSALPREFIAANTPRQQSAGGGGASSVTSAERDQHIDIDIKNLIPATLDAITGSSIGSRDTNVGDTGSSTSGTNEFEGEVINMFIFITFNLSIGKDISELMSTGIGS